MVEKREREREREKGIVCVCVRERERLRAVSLGFFICNNIGGNMRIYFTSFLVTGVLFLHNKGRV